MSKKYGIWQTGEAIDRGGQANVHKAEDTSGGHAGVFALRTIGFVAERKSGTYTCRCSRADLREIAGMMPPLADWGSEAFTEAKDAVKERFAQQHPLAKPSTRSKPIANLTAWSAARSAFLICWTTK